MDVLFAGLFLMAVGFAGAKLHLQNSDFRIGTSSEAYSIAGLAVTLFFLPAGATMVFIAALSLAR